MTDYSEGKIYKIVCNESGEVYIGSTVQNLNRRLNAHRYTHCSARQIINRGNYEIILLEEYPCNSDLEMRMREQYWLDEIQNINKYRAYISEEERAIYDEEYYILNKEQKSIRRKKMRAYQNTWGGNYNHNSHNNLLRIDINLFQSK